MSISQKPSLRANPRRALRRNLVAAILLLLAPCSSQAAELVVFAAASLTDALKEIAAGYEKQSGDKVLFNFAASSVLARQIAEGAPADVFFSADIAKMDQLEQKGLILQPTRKVLLSNSLVIVSRTDSSVPIVSPAGLLAPEVKRIALADPKTVPAGIYARTWLEREKIWSSLRNKVVPTDNVRAALAAVESGNVECGIVFKTDAAISRKVRIDYEVPVAETPDIRYPVAAVKESKQVEAAERFVQYLNSDAAISIFTKRGFIVLK